MLIDHLRRRMRLLVLVALIALVGALPVGPTRAQPGEPAAVARLQAAIDSLSQIEPAAGTAPATGAGPRPLYDAEGPRARPARSDAPSALAASLADQRDAKSAQRLTLSAASGAPGSAVTLTGRGYTPGQRVDLLWDGANITQRQMIVADANGRFEWRVRVPSPAVNGAHTLAALEARLASDPARASVAQQSGSAAAFTITGGLPQGSAAPSLEPPAVRPAEAPAPSAGGQPAQAPKPWTFAVYIAGDNNLSTYADLNLDQMVKSGGSNANANIVVLTDQIGTATRYDLITAAGRQNVTPAGVAGNINTGDPQKFVDFMGFVAQSYPAQRYAIVIWNHGGGWTSIESDDPTGDHWDMAEMRQALQGGLQRIGKPKYDVLLFDACLMAQYEVALEVASTVDVLVASEQTVPGAGTSYDTYLPALVTNPATTPEQFGNKIVETYAALYGADSNARDYTMSSLKIDGQMAAVQSAVDAFANALLAAGNTAAGDIQQARDASQTYAFPSFVDLADFANQVKARVSDPAVQQTANTLLGALALGGGFMLSEKHGPESPGSGGLTVYLPGPTTQGGYKADYDQLLVKGTPWHTFVNAFYSGKYPGNTGGQNPTPELPPPVSSSTSDIAYTQRYSPDQWDLGRIASVASPDEEAERFGMLSDGFRNTYPRWSPDGKVVAYVSDRAGGEGRTGLEQDLFLVKADGKPLDGEAGPKRMTTSAVSCPDGPGAGTECIVEQAYDPSWLGDGSGIVYTKLRVDLTNYPLVQRRQAIRLIDLTASSASDIELLPGRFLSDDVLVSNADFNGTLLVFRYSAPDGMGYHEDFVANNLAFVDISEQPAQVRYIGINSAEERTGGDYAFANYPTFRPGTNELAFLYSRVGDPSAFWEIDPREPPLPFEFENPFDTYDIGRMTLEKVGGGYQFTMGAPLWAFKSPETGEGVNLRPSWRPDGSGNLTASYSTDGGYTYNVGLLLNVADDNAGDDRLFALTSDGYSYLPSWGTVTPADVVARLEVRPAYLEPGANANYYLVGSGFAPGEQVQLTSGAAAIGAVQADAKGSFEAAYKLLSGAPGAVKFAATGATSGKTSNEGALVVLAPRNGARFSAYLPLVRK